MRLSSFRPMIVVAGVALVAMLPAYAVKVAQTFHIDFVAFWCGGSALFEHHNPYLDSALHHCETAHGLLPELTVPIPYPPYVMPLFGLFGALPFGVAFALWSCVSIAATALSGVALRRLTNLPWSFVTAATAALVLVPSLMLGQLVPFALCGFAWSLAWTYERRPVPAAVALLPMAVLPAFAVPVWLAAFIAAPRLRLPLLACGAVLLLCSAAIGLPMSIMYVSAVVPAHAASEVAAFWQLGTSALLTAAGMPQRIVPPTSFAIYVLGIVAGIFTGARLRARFGGDHWLPASAACFGLLTSPFVHNLDVGFALPLAFMLFAVSRSVATAVAAVLIIVPWSYLVQDTGIAAAIEIPLLLIVLDVFTEGRFALTAAVVLTIALGNIALYRGANAANLQLAAAHAVPIRTLSDTALAEVRWTAFAQRTSSTTASLYSRAPTQIAVLVLALTTIVIALGASTNAVEKSP